MSRPPVQPAMRQQVHGFYKYIQEPRRVQQQRKQCSYGGACRTPCCPFQHPEQWKEQDREKRQREEKRKEREQDQRDREEGWRTVREGWRGQGREPQKEKGMRRTTSAIRNTGANAELRATKPSTSGNNGRTAWGAEGQRRGERAREGVRQDDPFGNRRKVYERRGLGALKEISQCASGVSLEPPYTKRGKGALVWGNEYVHLPPKTKDQSSFGL